MVACARGENVLPPELVTSLATEVHRNANPQGPLLSERERQILRMIADGKTVRDMATELFLAETTIKTHIRRLYEKLGVSDRGAAVAYAMRNNLLLVGGIAAGLMALLLGAALAMARSVFNSLGAEPEHAVRATARIAGGDLTERLNAKTPKSLIGALEMMQSRLRNISLAIREVAFDIESRTTAMPQGPARELLAQTWVGGVCLVHEGRRAGRELAQLHFLRAREKLLADR